MPELTPYRKQVVDLVKELGDRPLIGVELGVWQGALSEKLLEAFPKLYLYQVDTWRRPAESSDYWNTVDPCARTAQEEFDEMYCAVMAMDHRHRRRVLRMTTRAAWALIDDTPDFVFIDADHSYGGVKNDLQVWAPSTPFVMGHDYHEPLGTHSDGCKRAVDEYAVKWGYTVHVGEGRVWWYDY